MKWTLFLSLVLGIALKCSAQTIVAAPNSMYLVYNNAGNYFYINIPGIEKSTTDIDNMYIVDGQNLQVLTIKKSAFLPDSLATAKPSEILEKYYAFEEEYLKSAFGDSASISKEAGHLPNGREYLFWSVKMPTPDTIESDSTSESLNFTTSQLYIATEIGDLVLAISSPYYSDDEMPYGKLKALLVKIIQSVTLSPSRIDIFELDRRVNGGSK